VLDGTTARLSGEVGLTDVPTAFVLDSTLDRLYALCWDGTIAAINCASEQVSSVVEVGEWFQTPVVEYAPGIGRIFCSDEYLDSVYFYDCASGRADGGAELESEPGCLCYNPANGLLYVSLLEEAILLVVDPVAGQVVDSIEVADDWGRLCCNVRDNKVYGGAVYHLYVVDGTSNRVIDSLAMSGSCSVVAHSALLNRVYVAVSAG